MTSASLTFRQPDMTWILAATGAALCLHGLVWFVAWSLFGDGDAGGEARRQMVLALFWMVCALILWRITPPPTRLHAVLGVLTCALFVTGLGSIAALIKLIVVDHATPTTDLLQTFLMLSVVLILAQLALAAPTAVLLQAVALRRKAD